MKRNHLALFLTLVAVALLATSCDTLFTNQFKALGLGQVASDAISNALQNHDGNAIVAESGISSGSISTSFIEAVVNSGNSQAVVDELKTTALTSTEPVTVEAAKVLIVQITLEASGTKAVVDNIISAIGAVDFSHFDITSQTDLNSLLAALFPSRSAKTLPEGWTVDQVAAILDTLAGSGTYGPDFLAALNSLASSLASSNGVYLNGNVDGGFIAQVAAMTNVLGQLTPAGIYAGGSVGNALAHLIDAYTSDPATDPAKYISYNKNTLLTNILGDSNLQALFTAAGMDLNTLLAGFNS